MSIYYDIKEHFIMKENDYETSYEALCVMQDELLKLGEAMLCDCVPFCQLRLTADGSNYFFEGNVPNAKLKELVCAFADAESADLVADYTYRFSDDWNIPFRMWDHMEKLVKEMGESTPDGLFYSVYNMADCASGGLGGLVAYGRRGGRLYNGELPRRSCALPEDGKWRHPDTFYIEKANCPKRDLRQLLDLAKEFGKFSTDYTESQKDVPNAQADQEYLRPEGSGISYYIGDYELHGRRDLDRYIKLVSRLRPLFKDDQLQDPENDGFFAPDEFVDLSGTDARFLHLNIHEDGSCDAEMTAV